MERELDTGFVLRFIQLKLTFHSFSIPCGYPMNIGLIYPKTLNISRISPPTNN